MTSPPALTCALLPLLRPLHRHTRRLDSILVGGGLCGGRRVWLAGVSRGRALRPAAPVAPSAVWANVDVYARARVCACARWWTWTCTRATAQPTSSRWAPGGPCEGRGLCGARGPPAAPLCPCPALLPPPSPYPPRPPAIFAPRLPARPPVRAARGDLRHVRRAQLPVEDAAGAHARAAAAGAAGPGVRALGPSPPAPRPPLPLSCSALAAPPRLAPLPPRPSPPGRHGRPALPGRPALRAARPAGPAPPAAHPLPGEPGVAEVCVRQGGGRDGRLTPCSRRPLRALQRPHTSHGAPAP
jgi:hypothetical protein